MELRDRISQLEKSAAFASWRKGHEKSYLAHIFRISGSDIWQFGYYNPDDTMTTFFLEGSGVREEANQEIFKKSRRAVPKLDRDSVSISFPDAIAKAEALQKEKHPQHPPIKTISVLQVLGRKTIYNITFVTTTMHTLNIHVDAKAGKILEEKLTSLMDLATFEKGKAQESKPDYVG